MWRTGVYHNLDENINTRYISRGEFFNVLLLFFVFCQLGILFYPLKKYELHRIP